MLVEMDVVSAKVPAFLVMDVLERESLISDTFSNCVTKHITVTLDDDSEHYEDYWFLPHYCARSGNLFLEVMPSTRLLYVVQAVVSTSSVN